VPDRRRMEEGREGGWLMVQRQPPPTEPCQRGQRQETTRVQRTVQYHDEYPALYEYSTVPPKLSSCTTTAPPQLHHCPCSTPVLISERSSPPCNVTLGKSLCVPSARCGWESSTARCLCIQTPVVTFGSWA